MKMNSTGSRYNTVLYNMKHDVIFIIKMKPVEYKTDSLHAYHTLPSWATYGAFIVSFFF